MNETIIQLESHWDAVLRNRYINQNSDILTIVLPGEGYTNEKPLMYYSCKIALEQCSNALKSIEMLNTTMESFRKFIINHISAY
jgi:hypothetical protein